MFTNGAGAVTIGSWPVASSNTRHPGSLRTRRRITATVANAGDVQSM
jgi:hypothetical protein